MAKKMASNTCRDTCVFCNVDLTEGTYKSKKRLLFGNTTVGAIKVLDDLSLDAYHKKFSDCKPPDDQPCYICHKCLKKVVDLPGLLKKVHDNKRDILHYIENSGIIVSRARPDAGTESTSGEISREAGTPSRVRVASRKRPRSDESDDVEVSVSLMHLYTLQVA